MVSKRHTPTELFSKFRHSSRTECVPADLEIPDDTSCTHGDLAMSVACDCAQQN